jgi:hypothetical protein
MKDIFIRTPKAFFIRWIEEGSTDGDGGENKIKKCGLQN